MNHGYSLTLARDVELTGGALHRLLQPTIRKTLVAGRVRVVSALGSGVISSGSSSTDAYYSRASSYGMTVDMMMVDMAPGTTDTNAGTPGTTCTNPGASGTTGTRSASSKSIS